MSIIFHLAGVAIVFFGAFSGPSPITTAALIIAGVGFLIEGIMDIVKIRRERK